MGFLKGIFDLNKDGKMSAFEKAAEADFIMNELFEDDNSFDEYDTDWDQIAAMIPSVYVDRTASDPLGFHKIEKLSEAGLLDLLREKCQAITSTYETLTVESGFRKIFDDRQLFSDFLMHGLTEPLAASFLDEEEQIRVASSMMQQLHIQNRTSVSDHFRQIRENQEYADYIAHCFSTQMGKSCLFWVILAHMGGDTPEAIKSLTSIHVKMAIGLTKDYIQLITAWGRYLDLKYSDNGFGYNNKALVKGKLAAISAALNKTLRSDDIMYIINPLYGIQ